MIKIICVGKIKEKYWDLAIEEYLKRLSKYVNVSIIEVPDSKFDDKIYSLDFEKKAIEKYINTKDYIITLEIDGKEYSSIEFSKKIDSILTYNSNITFIIGGSYGLHNFIIENSDCHLSFSKMTFPHQMFRVILLEQIYRAYKINNNEKYHK